MIPVARKLWQLTMDGSPTALARRLTIWNTICLFMRVPFRRAQLCPAPGRVHVLDQPVVRGHLVLLASLLVKKKHVLVIGDPVVLHIHGNHSTDPAECIEHGADERPVPEPSDLCRGHRLE